MRNIKIEQSTLDTIYHKLNYIEMDPYLSQNHNELFELFYFTYTLLPKENLQQLKETFSLTESIRLVSRFFYSLKNEYIINFIESLISGHINPLAEEPEYKRTKTNYIINFPTTSQIEDGSVLSHEYTHHLSAQFPKIKIHTSAYDVYKESLSILSELKYLDFLKEENLSQETELYRQYINKRYQPLLLSFLIVHSLFNIAKQEQTLENKNINDLIDRYSFYHFVKEEAIVNTFISLSNQPLEKFTNILEYQHSLGMIIAAHLHQENIKNEEFVELIEKINTTEVEEFETLLSKKSNIELAFQTKEEFTYQKRK